MNEFIPRGYLTLEKALEHFGWLKHPDEWEAEKASSKREFQQLLFDETVPAKHFIGGKLVKDWTYHACRDTVTTWLQTEGHSEFERGLVLNHAGAGTVTADYSHGYPVKLKRELLEKWAQHVENVVQPEGAVLLS